MRLSEMHLAARSRLRLVHEAAVKLWGKENPDSPLRGWCFVVSAVLREEVSEMLPLSQPEIYAGHFSYMGFFMPHAHHVVLPHCWVDDGSSIWDACASQFTGLDSPIILTYRNDPRYINRKMVPESNYSRYFRRECGKRHVALLRKALDDLKAARKEDLATYLTQES